jgi:transposase-like protein
VNETKPKLDADDLNLMSLAQEYSNEDKARELLEELRWPNGVACPHCKRNGSECKDVYRLAQNPKSKRPGRKGLFCCAACRKQFSVTVGTVFEGSHIPINKWLMAMFIICSSKKAISAHQLHRMLKLTYKTAWFMAHRIRFAMGPDPKGGIAMLKGIVEADETFVGGKGENRTKNVRHTPVAALIERGGDVRTKIIASVTAKNLGQFLLDNVSKDAVICTDEHVGYKAAGKQYKAHYAVTHSKKEYSRVEKDGTVTNVNHCESFFSLLKRGVFGAWHHVSPEHLPKYANEFEFRWNQRKVTDGKRMANFTPMIEGKRLKYRD